MQHRHPIFLLPDLRAEFRQFLRHGRYAVTLLMRRRWVPVNTPPQLPRRRSEQYGPQIGAGGDVQHRAGTFQPVQHVAAHPVALQTVWAQAGDGDAVSQRQQERRVDQSPSTAARRLAYRWPPGMANRFGPAPPPDAEGGHDVQCDVDIGAALHRRQNAQGAAVWQQRQRQQQSGDELAAHVSAQGIVPGVSFPENVTASHVRDTDMPFCARIVSYRRSRPAPSAARTGKRGASALQQRRRDAEAQGAAALAAGVCPRRGGYVRRCR